MKKAYKISEATRKRCKTIELTEKDADNYRILHLEQVQYLYEVKHIDFSLFFKIETTLIEFINPREFSHLLLDQLITAMNKDFEDLSICIRVEDYPELARILDNIRNRKIYSLIQKDPLLDQKTLQLFCDLTSVSQLIVKGGIDQETVMDAEVAIDRMIDSLLSSEVAIGTLSRMILADPTLYDHSASVAMIAGVIAHKLLKMDRETSKLIALCGMFHDVGKTMIPGHILHKPDKFSPDEFAIMKTHAQLGCDEITKAIEQGAPLDPVVARVSGEHHEKFRGGGYPNNKRGRLEEDEEHGIHEFTRIVSVADVFSALLMVRPYKDAFSPEESLGIMQKAAEQAYDPKIFSVFETCILKTAETYSFQIDSGKTSGRIIDMDSKKVRKQAQ